MEKVCCNQFYEILKIEPSEGDTPFESGNVVLYHADNVDEYGIIIHDGGESYIVLRFCPWCGSSLPTSKRSLWFEALEKLGFDEPLLNPDIPEEFRTSAWRTETAG